MPKLNDDQQTDLLRAKAIHYTLLFHPYRVIIIP